MARPTLYKKEYAAIAQRLCEHHAMTDAELALAFGVQLSTLKLWKSKHPEFMASLKQGKAPANERVEKSLYERAMGYTAVETDIRVINGKIIKTEVTRHYPPDPTSMIFWLKNRNSTQWSDKQEVQHTGTVELTDRILRARKNAAPAED